MSGRHTFAELAQKALRQRAQAAFGNGGGGGPRMGGGGGGGNGGPSFGQAVGGVGGVVLLAAAGLTINASLFNGASRPPSRLSSSRCRRADDSASLPSLSWTLLLVLPTTHCSRWWSPRRQVHPLARCHRGGLQRRNSCSGTFLARSVSLPALGSPGIRTDPLVRDAHHLRRPLQASKHRLAYRHQGYVSRPPPPP